MDFKKKNNDNQNILINREELQLVSSSTHLPINYKHSHHLVEYYDDESYKHTSKKDMTEIKMSFNAS